MAYGKVISTFSLYHDIQHHNLKKILYLQGMLKKLKSSYRRMFGLQDDASAINKIEARRIKIFNLALAIESVLLVINIIRHLFKSDFSSALAVFVLLIVLLALLFTTRISNKKKYAILFVIACLFVLIFNHFVESTKDVIQTYYVLFFICGIFLKDKQFAIGLATAVVLYYFSFFWLGYHTIFNFLGALPFIFLAIVIRIFIIDAEKNEAIISRQVNELKEIDTLKTRFFANISHEFRTPLTLILGANENLENIKAPLKYTESIKNNSQRLLELVNQILELEKAANKKRPVKISKVDFKAFIQGHMSGFSSLSESKNIRFQNQVDQNLNAVYIDVDSVSKIISNLLGNAFKFCDAGDTVLFEALYDKESILLKITDTGKGISEQELPYIFNQYFYSNVGPEASSGIGLALVNELVVSLGGKIEVISKEKVGSCFTVTLPISLRGLEQAGVNYTVIENAANQTSTNLYDVEVIDEQRVTEESESEEGKKLLLLVEDNAMIRDYIKEVIAPEYTLIEAIDGKMGIEKAIEFTPDIIISDVMMPKVDGLQLLQELKKDIRTSHIPIIILTAKTSETDKLKGLEYEADDYLTKPFNQTELLLRLKNRISARVRMQKSIEAFSIKNLKNTDLMSVEDKFLQSIKQKIEQHLLNDNFGPDELAREIGLSKSQLLRKIRAVANVSTSIYIRNIRLEFAKEKLINNTGSISEIAYETGFSSPNYFSKCFREYTNQTPKEFLENL